MSERPTPENVIAEGLEMEAVYGTIDSHAYAIKRLLIEAGYVIVHPDDVETPRGPLPTAAVDAYWMGWKAHHAAIFGKVADHG